MQINIPLSKAQKEFEQWAYIIVQSLEGLTVNDLKQIYNFIVFVKEK